MAIIGVIGSESGTCPTPPRYRVWAGPLCAGGGGRCQDGHGQKGVGGGGKIYYYGRGGGMWSGTILIDLEISIVGRGRDALKRCVWRLKSRTHLRHFRGL